jgi:hypothetical protein
VQLRIIKRQNNAGIQEVAMSRRSRRSSSCLLWPFVALFRLLAGILILAVRFVFVVVGLVLIIVGLLISLTIVGAIVGIPLALVGLLLVFLGLS